MKFPHRLMRVGLFLLWAGSAGAQTLSFTGLTNPFPGVYVDGVRSVNADGSVVVGYTYKPTTPDFGNRSFRWQRTAGFDNPGPTQGITLSFASGVSSDGSVICGSTGHAQFGDQEAWVRVGTSRGHVGSPPGHDFSTLLGVSANGSVAVGFGGNQINPNSSEAAFYLPGPDRWTNLGFLPGGAWSKALACSADGSFIVGRATGAGVLYSSAFVWTAGTGMRRVDNGNLPNGNEAAAVGISADGSVIVGQDYVIDPAFNSTLTSWRWTAATGMTALPSDMIAMGVSPDGMVVIGQSTDGTPLIWDQAHGLRDLATVCESLGLGPAMAGWFMGSATAINQQGGVYAIAGEGGDPAGFIAGWVVRLDRLEAAACYANCDASTTPPVLNVLDFACFLNQFASADPAANCDQSTTAPTLNVLDFACFLNRFAAGCP